MGFVTPLHVLNEYPPFGPLEQNMEKPNQLGGATVFKSPRLHFFSSYIPICHRGASSFARAKKTKRMCFPFNFSHGGFNWKPEVYEIHSCLDFFFFLIR